MKDLATECLKLPLFSESGLGVPMMPPVIPVGLKLFQRRSLGKRNVHPPCHRKYVSRYVLSGTTRILRTCRLSQLAGSAETPSAAVIPPERFGMDL